MPAIMAAPVMEPERLPRLLARFPHTTIITRQAPAGVSGLSLTYPLPGTYPCPAPHAAGDVHALAAFVP
jgi:hypothetical protein